MGGPKGGWGHKQTRASKYGGGGGRRPWGLVGRTLGSRTGDRVSGCEVRPCVFYRPEIYGLYISMLSAYICPRVLLHPRPGKHHGVGMFGVNTERKIRGPVREMRAGRVWGASRCLPRGQGLCSRTVAMSQAPEDRARTKRWRVLTQIVLSRRGRLVSRFGQNHVKSTTWTPSTARRTA